VERRHFRSTSLVDIQAELHKRELLSDVRRATPVRGTRRPRASSFGLSQLRRRILG